LGPEAAVRRMVARAVNRGRTLWGTRLAAEEVEAVVREAYAMADTAYTAEVAAAWGERELSGGIPLEIPAAHVRELQEHGGDLDAMVGARLQKLAPTRLNPARVQALSRDNPERERLLDLADGIMVATPPGFYPNGDRPEERPPLRKLYQKTHKAVGRMFLDLVEEGLAIILPSDVAFRIPGLHVSPAHWAPKA
jgi:hypothetical protein